MIHLQRLEQELAMNRIRIGLVANLALFLFAANAGARAQIEGGDGWSEFWR